MVFQELPTSRFTPFLPLRNPLAEVRWLEFLRGDAYVNLLQDLLYALARPHGRNPLPKREGRRQFRFKETEVVVERPEGEPLVYAYADLFVFKLNYTSVLQEQPAFLDTSHQVFYTVLHLGTTDAPVRAFKLVMTKSQCLELLDFLYARRVSFQEFYGSMRSFRLNANINYRRVQELKAEYGIEW